MNSQFNKYVGEVASNTLWRGEASLASAPTEFQFCDTIDKGKQENTKIKTFDFQLVRLKDASKAGSRIHILFFFFFSP